MCKTAPCNRKSVYFVTFLRFCFTNTVVTTISSFVHSVSNFWNVSESQEVIYCVNDAFVYFGFWKLVLEQKLVQHLVCFFTHLIHFSFMSKLEFKTIYWLKQWECHNFFKNYTFVYETEMFKILDSDFKDSENVISNIF